MLKQFEHQVEMQTTLEEIGLEVHITLTLTYPTIMMILNS